MRGTALQLGTVGMWLCCALAAGGGCSFDASSFGGGGGGEGDGSAADGSPASPDGAPAGGDAAAADAAVPTTALVTCSRTEVPPALDGAAMGPWNMASFIEFAASDGELVADVHSNYDFDARVSFACLHDDENLYFFGDVTDAEVVNDSLSLREDDGVVIFLDGGGDRDGTYGEDDHALVIGAEAESWDYGPGEIDPAGMVVLSEGGYRFEIAIDKAAIAGGALPAELGFNLAIIDDDGLGNANRDVFALRHVPHPPACDGCCEGQAQPWCDTTQLGALDLLE